MIKFNITSNDGNQTSVTAFVNGKPLVATNTHPNFLEITDTLLFANDDTLTAEQIEELFNVGVAIERKFKRVSDRVMIAGSEILFDGDPIHGVLAETIVKAHSQANQDFLPLVLFLEKIASNPNAHSREHLYLWLENFSFQINDDGDFIAYKSVYGTGNDDDYVSCTSGTAIVNGEVINGQIPNNVGDVIEMPRSEVEFNPSVGCSTGLHAGTYSYAETFSGDTILRVKINPRDVVSVPTDCGAAKLRVCRYQVLDVMGKKGYTAPQGNVVDHTPVPAVKKRTRSDRRKELESKNRDQLRQIATRLEIPGRGSALRAELIELILDHTDNSTEY